MMQQTEQWLPVLTGIFFSTIGFTIYHFLNEAKARKSTGDRYRDFIAPVLFQRMSGLLIFGVLPALTLFRLTGEAALKIFDSGSARTAMVWFFPVAILVVAGNYFNAGTESNLKMYPQIRSREWNITMLLTSALSWILYLLAYEFLFRGLLFLPLAELTGLWPAVIVNTGIYSLVHIPKGIKEGLGAIPFGVIICLLVFKTGSFWIAFFIHVVMALSNEWFSLLKNPEIRYNRK